jgi:hypothetical protein
VRETRNAIKILVGKHVRRRLLGRPRHRWEDNMYYKRIREIGWEGVDWMHLPQDMD